MKIEKYEKIVPPAAMAVRNAVFVVEQGFVDECDEIDSIATHFVLYDGESPVGTCRVFLKDATTYCLGRFAVMKPYRGKHWGSMIAEAAENDVRSKGGTCILLHSQYAASGFYRAIGYEQIGERDEEQGCPHVWMVKYLTEERK